MKQIWVLLILVQFAIPVLTGQGTKREKSTTKSEKPASQSDQKILQLENDYFDAKLENNVKFMEGFLADDFLSVNQFGHTRNKTQSLAFYKGFKPRSLTMDDIKVVHTDDSIALVEGHQTENGEKFSFSHKLIKQNGAWKIISVRQNFAEFQKLNGIGYYKITGTLRGAEGITVNLVKYVGNQRETINSAVVRNGMFTLEGKAIQYPEISYLVAQGKREQAIIFLENAEISLSGHIDSLSRVTVKGSKTHNEYMAFLDKVNSFRGRYESLISDHQAAKKANDTVRLLKAEDQLKKITGQILQAQKDFIMENPASYTAPAILNGIAGSLSIQETDEILGLLDPGVAKTAVALGIRERNEALKLVDLGKKAPDFTLKDEKGNPVSLSSKTGSKLLLIDFWAGWCAPCRKENPNLVKVYRQFKKDGFEILGVSLDRTRDEWVKAIAADSLTWTQVSDLQYWNSEAAKLYSVTSIPANFLLDRNGIIIAKNLRGEKLREEVIKQLGLTGSKK